MKKYTQEEVEQLFKDSKVSGKAQVKDMRKKIKAAKMQVDLVTQTSLNELMDGMKGLDIETYGLTLKDITKQVLGKTYPSIKDTKYVYRMLQLYKNSNSNPIVFINGKYGWASTREEVESYYGDQAKNVVVKIRNIKKGVQVNSQLLQIPMNATQLLEDKRKEILPDERLI